MYSSHLNKKSCGNRASSENSFDVELRPTPGYERIRHGVGCNGERRNGDVSYVRSVTPSRVVRDVVTCRVLHCHVVSGRHCPKRRVTVPHDMRNTFTEGVGY